MAVCASQSYFRNTLYDRRRKPSSKCQYEVLEMSESFSEQIRNIADKIKTDATTDRSSGYIDVDEYIIDETLPESLTRKTLEEVSEYQEQLAAGLILATGEIGGDLLKDNTNLDTVRSQLKTPDRSFDVEYNRKITQPSSSGEPGEQENVYGHTQLKVTSFEDSEQITAVQNHIQQRANEIFS